MGFFSRLAAIIKAKVNKLLDRAEDPRETLDYSYEKQLEMLTKVRRGMADVATGKKRLDLQIQQLTAGVAKLEGQAKQALGAGREDLARVALERKAGLMSQIESITGQRDNLQAEQDKLVLAEQKLTARVEAFRTQKETIKAQYSAAEAQTKINEAFSGVSEELSDVGLAIQRAEEKTQTMQARAGAIDELLASGALDDPTGLTKDNLTRELESMASQSDVDSQLAALKAEIGGPAPAAVEAPSAPAVEAAPASKPTAPPAASPSTPTSSPSTGDGQ